MTKEAAQSFRQQFREARENALKDAEAFDGIIHVVERLGIFLLGEVENLHKYQHKIEELAKRSPLAADDSAPRRNFHTPFRLLYTMVKDARNDAMHMGASARPLTTHAIELALILEDALMTFENCRNVSDYMVRAPVCAHLWQPISFVRERMLTNSFSYLPVKNARTQWCLVSDLQVAKYLQCHSNGKRKERLATPLGEATEIAPGKATWLKASTPMVSALEKFDGTPILVYYDNATTELAGILTAFDVL